MPPSSRARRIGTTTFCATPMTPTSGAVRATRLGADHFRVVTGAGYVNSDMGWLRLQFRDGDPRVELRESTEDLSVVGLWGPCAREILGRVTRDDVTDKTSPFMQARTIDVGGAP